MQELYTMSYQELSRLEVIQKLMQREMRQETAAELLGVSIRQVQRLLCLYRTQGPSGLVSKKRG